MEFFKKYIAPAIHGLIVYAAIRLVNDVGIRFEFWKRWWGTTLIEVLTCIVVGYLSMYLLRRLKQKLIQEEIPVVTWQHVLKDFLRVYCYSFFLINIVMTPIVAITDDGLSIFDFLLINTIPMVYILLLFAIMRGNVYLEAYVTSRLKVEEVKREQLRSEIAYLKAQIHPHFLFNALNTIYFEMDEDVNGAKSTIEKFSQLLRYQLSLKEGQKIEVYKAFDYLDNYILLQQKRFSTKLKLTKAFPKNMNQDVMIHPFLMLPLVENAFKYLGGAYQMEIEASMVNNRLDFRIKNTKALAENVLMPSSEIGLENLERRLDLFYGGVYSLVIDDAEEFFEVCLKIELL